MLNQRTTRSFTYTNHLGNIKTLFTVFHANSTLNLQNGNVTKKRREWAKSTNLHLNSILNASDGIMFTRAAGNTASI